VQAHSTTASRLSPASKTVNGAVSRTVTGEPSRTAVRQAVWATAGHYPCTHRRLGAAEWPGGRPSTTRPVRRRGRRPDQEVGPAGRSCGVERGDPDRAGRGSRRWAAGSSGTSTPARRPSWALGPWPRRRSVLQLRSESRRPPRTRCCSPAHCVPVVPRPPKRTTEPVLRDGSTCSFSTAERLGKGVLVAGRLTRGVPGRRSPSVGLCVPLSSAAGLLLPHSWAARGGCS